METKLTITGMPLSEIKEMIEDKYGACVWGVASKSRSTCYPTSSVEVVVSVQTRQCSHENRKYVDGGVYKCECGAVLTDSGTVSTAESVRDEADA